MLLLIGWWGCAAWGDEAVEEKPKPARKPGDFFPQAPSAPPGDPKSDTKPGPRKPTEKAPPAPTPPRKPAEPSPRPDPGRDPELLFSTEDRSHASGRVIAAGVNVFRVRALDAEGNVLNTGSAFLADGKGHAVTSFRALEGCTRAEALIGEHPPIPVRLYLAEVELDLAVIHVDQSGLAEAERLTPLAWLDSAFPIGDLTWALGYSDTRRRAVHGSINRNRLDVFAGDDLRAAMPGDRKADWIVHTSRVEREMAGGPLVNIEGRVVGINILSALGPVGASLSLGAADVRGALARLPREPVAFEKAWKASPGAPVVLGKAPVIEVEHAVKHEQMRRLVEAFQRAAACNECEGKGVVTKRVKTGYQGDGGGVRKPTFDNVERRCDRCDGKRLSEPKAMEQTIGRLVEGLAGLDTDEPEVDEVLREMSKSLSIVFGGTDYQSVSANKLLGDGPRPSVGTPAVVSGNLFTVQGPFGSVRLLCTRNGRYVAITHPTTSPTGDSYDYGRPRSLAGGVYAGDIELGGGRRIPVLQNGFIQELSAPPRTP